MIAALRSAGALLRPNRRLAFPFAAVLYPLLWFVARDADIAASVGSAHPTRTLGLAAVSVVASYVLAVLAAAVAATLDSRRGSVPTWTRPLVRPSDATLAVFAGVSLALGYAVFSGVPLGHSGWLSPVARLLGAVVGWPLVVSYAAAVAASDALGVSSFAAEAAAVVLGVGLSVAWLFVLSGWLVALLGGRSVASPATAR